MQYIIVFVYSVLDHIFTCLHLSLGAEEANIIWRGVLENMPFWQSFIIRNSWMALFLVLLYLLAKKTPVFVRKCMNIVIGLYSLVMLWHLYGFARYAYIVSQL